MALATTHPLTGMKSGWALAGSYAEGGDQRGDDRASRSNARGTDLGDLDTNAQDLWRLPISASYQVSSPFGARDYPNPFHNGFDMAVPEGTAIYAAADGVVKLARWNGGYGNCTEIDIGGGFVMVYGHQSRLLVQEGQVVKAGTLIGLSGNTGFSTGAHLHFEIDVNGVAVDPAPIMLKHGVDLYRHIEVVRGGVIT